MNIPLITTAFVKMSSNHGNEELEIRDRGRDYRKIGLSAIP